jgi:hypothetical protein
VIGTPARQLWALAGPNQNVNQTLLQAFVNYNMSDGRYAVSSPIITALERVVRAALECSDRRWRSKRSVRAGS